MSSTAPSIAPEPEAPAATPAPEPTQPTKGRSGFMGILQIVAVVAAVGMAVAYSRDDTAAQVAPPSTFTPAAQSDAAAPLARVMLPERQQTQITLAATGTVEVRNTIDLAPQIGGQVVSVAESLRVGGSFAADEVLFTIDPRDYELALAQAEAELASAEARLKLQQAESDAARENYALLHGDKPAPDLVAKVPQIEASKAEVAGARARVARAELDLARTEFSLPFAGRVAENSIAPGQTLIRGQSSGQVFATDAIEVSVPVAAGDLSGLEPVVGRMAEVQSGGRTFAATVERRSAVLDERTRFARLYLKLEDGAELPPGTFVDVTLKGAELADTFVIPESAQQAEGNLWVVSNGALTAVAPTVFGRLRDGLVVAPFDYGEGVVLGSVPGATVGSRVTTERGGQASMPGG